jgi:hypothetical protein
MLKTAARILLLRVLPRRLLPVLTVVEAVLLLRNVRRRAGRKVNDPIASRTAPPRNVTGSSSTPPGDVR